MKKFSINVFRILIILSFISCGTETTYYLQQPISKGKEPNYETQFDEAFFRFEARSKGQQGDIDEGFKYNGTAVYYKIYNNYSEIASRKSSINSLNESNNESSAANSLINSYGYKQLGTNKGNLEPLIDDNGGVVEIRLYNYFETQYSVDDYKKYERRAYIKINDTDYCLPLRSENNFTFDFGRKDTDINLVPGLPNEYKVDKDVRNAIPKSDDSMGDVYKSSSFSDSDSNIWYVDMYAVSVGRDNNFVQYYSKVLYLGCVAIDSSKEYK